MLRKPDWPSITQMLVYGAVFVFSLAFFFSRAVTQGISHDEYQFIAPAQLLAERGLLPYIDYPYLHMPYIVVINAPTAWLSTYDMLALRSLSALWMALSLLVIFYLADHILVQHPRWLRWAAGLAVILLLLLNPVVIGMGGRALNHFLPALLSLLALLAFRAALAGGQTRYYFLCGLLAGAAPGVRLSYAVLLPVFALALLIFRFQRQDRVWLRSLAGLAAGAGVALLPLALLLLRAPSQFFYGNYVYIRLNTQYRQLLEHDVAMTLRQKAAYFLDYALHDPINWLIYAAALVCALFLGLRWLKTRHPALQMPLLAVALSAALFATAFAPTPSWTAYFFAPLPFMVLLLLYALDGLKPKHARLALVGVLLITLLGTLSSGTAALLGQDLTALATPQCWQPMRVHWLAQEIKTHVAAGKVLTLAPILPLEGGLDTYEVFAVGPFSWRTAHLVGKDQRQEFEIISYHELPALLQADPPAAIVTGVEEGNAGFKLRKQQSLEQPFIDYALQNGYQALEIGPHCGGQALTLWDK